MLDFCQNAYLNQETGQVKKQTNLPFRRHLDSFSPPTPHWDEFSTVLRKEREMPPLCL